MLETYILSFDTFKKANDNIEISFNIIESKGGLRFTTGGDKNVSIIELSEAIEGVSDFEKVVEDKQKATSQEIGALLKGLKNRYTEFEHEVKKFNNQINKRQISNIKSIEFVIDNDNEILKVITKLVDQDTIFASQDDVHKTVQRLDDLITKHNVKLSIENLFNLGVAVELENNKVVTSFSDTNIESTGTGLTVNVILNVMLLNKLMLIKDGQLTNIPIYIDEAERIDPNNQATLIEQCMKSGFIPVFASVHGQSAADYWIGLEEIDGRVYVDQSKWYKIEKEDPDNVVNA